MDMALPPQVNVWDLWAEAARQTETLGDPLFLECLDAASNSRIFEHLTDDKLKVTLSIINSLLNDPKTKSKGMTLFSDLATQINPSRLIGFQDAVISSLHLVVKGLDTPLANTALVSFLPKCHCMSEVNQVVISSIVPKFLSQFVEGNQTSVSQRCFEELCLLKVCLLEYHGPCGNFREKLEKVLMPLIDSDNEELVQVVSEVLPLLSYAGGGGNAGEKHIKDWNEMLTKCLSTAFSILIQMYGDSNLSLETGNPFEQTGQTLSGLKRIVETKVLLRLSLLKRRLLNLLNIISGYLRFPFPAPKLVPQKGILKLITCLTSVVPLVSAMHSSTKSQTKENIFLMAITPGVHMQALNLLKALFSCVGTNIFTEATTVEQILSSEFKWLQEMPRAFEKLRLELYDSVTCWLTLTGGSVTHVKTLTLWINAIGVDTRVEKDVVELKVLSKPKPGKSVKLTTTNSITLSSGSTTQVFVRKSSEICHTALKTLTWIIPALDGDNHKKVYEHLLKTASIIGQFHCPPSPYDAPECRKLIFINLTRLCQSPHAHSPVSISVVVTLLRNGMQDPTSLVSSCCSKQLSQLERLLHPIAAPLILAGPSPHPVIMNNSSTTNFTFSNDELENEISSDDDVPPQVINLDRISQHMNAKTNSEAPANGTAFSQSDLLAALRSKMEESINEVLANYPAFQNKQDEITSNGNRKKNSETESTGINYANHSVESVETSNNDLLESQRLNEDVSLDNNDNFDHNVTGINGNGYHSDDIVEDESYVSEPISDSNGDLKRKALSVDEGEQDTLKKSKVTSPIKRAESVSVQPVEGPSVEEMLCDFVDLEAVV